MKGLKGKNLLQTLIGEKTQIMDPEIDDTPSSINDNLYQYFMNKNNETVLEAPSTSLLADDFQI